MADFAYRKKKAEIIMRKNGLIYVSAVSVAFLLRRFYSTADSDALIWILAPAAWCVKILGGISFEYVAQIGYVSDRYRFIIAASCAGVRFLVLTFLMAVFSFTHRLATGRKKVLWLVFSMGFAYVTTVIVNEIRITAAIYIPLFLEDKGLMPKWLTSERLHTMIGTTVYFSVLFILYIITEKICTQMFGAACGENEAKCKKKIAVPVFWYAAVVLVIPFLGRLYQQEWSGFLQYAALVTGVCVAVMAGFSAVSSIITSMKTKLIKIIRRVDA